MIQISGTVFAALLGLAFGSFLNVCLTRWPAGESVVGPRSHCRNCGRTLAWWENVPLVSWIALRGRCHGCRKWIGWRYPLVELAVGGLWAVAAWQTGSGLMEMLSGAEPGIPVSFSSRFLFQLALTLTGNFVFTWILVGLAALDLEHLWLPNLITLPGIVLGIVFTALHGNPILEPASSAEPVLEHLLTIAFAILIAGGMILLIRWTYWLIRRQEGIGMGDAKLMAMLAAWLGLPGALLAFALGILLGSAAAMVMLVVPAARREPGKWVTSKLPLGTFLCIGGIVSALWGPQIIAAYLHLEGFR